MTRVSRTLAVLLLGSAAPLLAAEPVPKAKSAANFGSLRAQAPDTARTQAQDWLKTTGKADAAQFEAIWNDSTRPLLDRVSATLELGDPTARQLLNEARDLKASAPTDIPACLKDAKLPNFYRANLALAYAKALSGRKIYEEALESLRTVKPEDVVDPGVYFFTRAVAEYELMLRRDADESIVRLLDDVTDAPERYKMVAALMHFDMQLWKDKDLGWISRKMDNIERRLGHARGGPTTQKMEKEVVMRLDELIKEKENQKKGNCKGNGGSCPNGGNGNNPNNNTQASSPQNDSNGGNGSGPGKVDPRKIKDLAEQWGKLPEKERAKALLDLTRDMPPRYREQIEAYFKKIQESETK